MKHVFSICAYKESPYLEQCIRSVINAADDSEAIICTSTPNRHISGLSEKYGLRLFIRDGKSSLKDDWNFAIESAAELGAGLITIAHQDDIYEQGYAGELFRKYHEFKDMSLFFTDCFTIDNSGRRVNWISENIKRILRLLLTFNMLGSYKFIKRSVLMFGNGICCPSCTYNIEKTGLPVFTENANFVIDWLTLIRLSEMQGRFVYSKKKLMSYRVHAGSATNDSIKSKNREAEEYRVFLRLWPKWAAWLIMKLYKLSSKAYTGGRN